MSNFCAFHFVGNTHSGACSKHKEAEGILMPEFVEEIADLSKDHCLELLEFWKPGLMFWYHMLCKGAPENIQRFDKALKKKGHEVRNRCPAGGFEI